MCRLRLLSLFLLDFAEDDVHVCQGDALAVNHAAVFAEFGPVLAVHFLASSTCVAVDGEALEGLFQSCHLHRCGGTLSSLTGPVGLGGQPFGRSVFRVFAVRSQGS